jgi:hypothetical protein
MKNITSWILTIILLPIVLPFALLTIWADSFESPRYGQEIMDKDL